MESQFSFGWKLYRHTLDGTWKAFGLSRELFNYGIRKPTMKALVEFMMACDHLFFPGFRKVDVKSPVFLIGHPRSGTTFMHRLLTQTDEFSVFRFWEVMFPSLTLRRIIGPAIQRIIKAGKGTMLPKETGHHGALDAVEEEEMLYYFDGNTQFTSCLTPMAFSDWDFTDLVMADEQSPAVQQHAMKFLRGCLKRQSYSTGKPRAVTKMNYSAMRTKALLKEFPDGKIVYIVRSPLETIPSHLTLHRNMFNHLWGIQRIPQPLLRRYYERRYRHNLTFYRYMEDLITSGEIPADRLLVVPYDDLRNRLEETMDRVIEFAELECSDELRRQIREQSQSQSSYVRPHKNSDLSEFGLTEERIVSDFGFIFDKYGFSTGNVDTAKTPAGVAG